MQADEKDLRQRTKEFALQIIRVFSELPKTIVRQECDELIAIFVTILKSSKDS